MHEKVFIHSIECLAHKETANLCVKKTSFSKPYILAIMSKLIKKQWQSVSWQLSLNFKAQLQNQEKVINENGSCTFKRNKLRNDKNYLSIYWLCFLQKSAWSREGSWEVQVIWTICSTSGAVAMTTMGEPRRDVTGETTRISSRTL